MANPQLENGHIRIANEVLNALIKNDFSGAEFSVILSVLRKTWGWSKKQEGISVAEFCDITGRTRTRVIDALKNLKLLNILKCASGGGRGNVSKWSFNKDWESWQTVRNPDQFKSKTVRNPDQFKSKTVRNPDQFKSKSGPVSPCNLLPGLEQLAPKYTFKDNIQVSQAQPAIVADKAFDFFAAEFERKTGSPYMNSKGDFVQLAALRKSFRTDAKEKPPGWDQACRNYLNSPMGSYTVAYMVTGNRYAVFRRTEVNEFGKPEKNKNLQVPGQAKDFYDEYHYETLESGKIVAVKNKT